MISIETFKARRHELYPFAETLINAKAHEEVARDVVIPIREKLLKENGYEYSPEHKSNDRRSLSGPITKVSHDFLMSDKDFSDYYSKSRAAQVAAGVLSQEDSDKELDGLSMAETFRSQAERAFVDQIFEVLEFPFTYRLDTRKKLVDITLKCLAGDKNFQPKAYIQPV